MCEVPETKKLVLGVSPSPSFMFYCHAGQPGLVRVPRYHIPTHLVLNFQCLRVASCRMTNEVIPCHDYRTQTAANCHVGEGKESIPTSRTLNMALLAVLAVRPHSAMPWPSAMPVGGWKLCRLFICESIVEELPPRQ